MEPTSNPEVTESCSTCLHETKEATVNPMLCNECTSYKTLVYWEPKEKPKAKPMYALQSNFDSFVADLKPLDLEAPLEPLEYAKLHGATDSALDMQVGGSHYKNLKIQPMEYSMANKLDACQHTVIKYVTRHETKGGREDLEKAKHAIDLLIDFKYGVA